MMWFLQESPQVVHIPEKIKSYKNKDFIRMECILQTANEINKNKRRYPKTVLETALGEINESVRGGMFLGELDHPIDSRPARQVTVLLDKSSHRIIDYGWDGNNLRGVIETLNTPKGFIQRNLALQGVPVGYSLRAVGEVREVTESVGKFFDVHNNLKIFTYDCVSNPSHAKARMQKITESFSKSVFNEAHYYLNTRPLYEECVVSESKNMICTENGVCYLPNQFDKLVESRIIKLKNKFK